MRWKTWKVYFLAYCLRLWGQSVNSIPTNLCVCVHICSCACAYSRCLSPFKCVKPPMVLSISLFMALWVSPHVKLLFSLQHQHEVTGFINHGWQTRGALGTIIAQLYREKDNMETWLLTIARDLCLSVCPVSRAVYLINFTLGGYIAGEQGCAVSNLVQCGHVACLILINFGKTKRTSLCTAAGAGLQGSTQTRQEMSRRDSRVREK